MNTDLIREIFRTKAQIFIVMELDPNARLSTILSRRLKANNALTDSDWDKILLSVAMLFSGMDENFIHGQIDCLNDVYLLDYNSTEEKTDFTVRVDFSMGLPIR